MNRFAQTIRALMPNCRQAIRLQSEALDRPLSRWERLGLRLHLVLCVWCLRYGQQLKFLRTAAQNCEHDHEPKQTLPVEARMRIKQALADSQKPPD